MKLLLLILIFAIGIGANGQKVDSVDIEKWERELPYCDSIKSWYYAWSYFTPDGKAQGWGEYTWCRWTKPTVKEVLANVKRMLFYKPDDLKRFKYVKVDIITEGEEHWCPCQKRKKGF